MAHMFMSHTTGINIWLELRGLPLIKYKFISGPDQGFIQV